MSIIALDLETAPSPEHPQEYALQPWRAREGTGRITSMAISEPDSKPVIVMPDKIHSVLPGLVSRNAYVATWNGVFDVAWLLASGYEKVVDRIKWLDAMLLWKWVDNGQIKEQYDPNWSLVDGVKRWIDFSEEPWAEAYLRMKKNEPKAGEEDQYWQVRAQFDALATRLIAEKVIKRLTPAQQRSALIEAECILPVAESWLRGVNLNVDLASKMMPAITDEMQEIEYRLGVSNDKKPWTPSKILRSPKQLAETLYDKWRLPVLRETPKGDPSTDKATLTYLTDYNDKALSILRWRELNTQFTKFIQGIHKTQLYLNSNICHPGPRIFSTYTGRMTYSSKSGSKGAAAKAKIGVPIHQWPRPKALRKLVIAEEGRAIVEFDASGQEVRFMACRSQDEAMLGVLNSPHPRDDIHSFMGSRLSGINFEAFLQGKADGVEAIVGPTGYRFQGKFNILSSQYRIGRKSLRIKSRVDYGMDVDMNTVVNWNKTYHRTFKGIKRYWHRAINIAKQQGYAETFAGRRFKLEFWDKEREFGTGQSAINFPIQGAGGDQKELALMLLTKNFPELDFFMDLHDGLYFYADIDRHLPDMLNEARHMLNSIDYVKYWNWKPSVPLVWDCSLGVSWGEKTDLKVRK